MYNINIVARTHNVYTFFAILIAFILFHSKTEILRQFNIAGKDKTFLTLYADCPLF
jgi:hypothetical protein